jgi:hypothetical protein
MGLRNTHDAGMFHGFSMNKRFSRFIKELDDSGTIDNLYKAKPR